MQLKKFIMAGALTGVAAAICMGDASVPDLKNFKDQTRSSCLSGTIVEGFDGKLTGWKLPKGAIIEKHAGRNGTAALLYQRTNPKVYGMTTRKVDLKPGTVYTASVWIRTENFKSHTRDRNFGGLCIEYSKNGKWHGGTYPQNCGDSPQWRKLNFTFTAKKTADKATIVLYIRKGFTGKIWFDDFKLEPAGASHASLLLNRPICRTIWNGNGNITFQVVPVSKKIKNSSNLRLLVTVNSKSSSITKLLNLKKDFSAKENFGKLAQGSLSVKATLLDMKSKNILARSVFELNSKGTLEPPEGACLIDNYNRAIVDGKPFMPIGIYNGGINETDLKCISSAGFNCLILYSSMYLKIGKNDNSLPGIKKSLDLLNNYNLKLIFSLKDQYPWKSWARKRIDGAKGIDNVTAQVVKTLGKHPAILAWYMSDEEIRSRIPAMEKVRDLVNRLDPYHPTFSLTFRFEDFPFYAKTGDIMGVDVYPVKDNSTHSMGKISKGMDAVDELHKPVWFVPQAFNWGVYKTKNAQTFKQNFRFPTETEIRSMTLLPAIRGAKGFIFYHYGDIMSRAEKLSPGSSKKEWPKLCRVVKDLKELEPFIMSTEQAPEVKITGSGKKIQARAFKNNQGGIRVIIAGLGPGTCKAVFTVPGHSKLKSKYGLCKSLGDGRYEFTGKNICSDILY